MDVSNGISIVIPAFVVGSGIALCAGVQFGLAGIVGERTRLYQAFSALCLCIGVYLYTSAGYYSAHSVEQAAHLLHWQTGFGILFHPAFFWFVALYTQQSRIKPWLTALIALSGIYLIADYVSPYSIRFSTLRAEEPLRLPWGESLARFSGDLGVWRVLATIMSAAVFFWAIWRTVNLFRRSRRLSALFLAVCCLVLFATSTLALFIDIGAAHFFYLFGFAFLGLVLFMSASFAVEFHRRSIAVKQSGQSLSKSENQLAGIIDSAMDAIVSHDQRGRIVLFNAAAERMFGCPAREAIGRDVDRFIPRASWSGHNDHSAEFGRPNVRTRRMAPFREIFGVRADGKQFPVEASISQLESAGEKFYTVIVRDITDRLEAEEALRFSEERFRNVADTAPVMIWMSGQDKQCTYFNRFWLEFTGRSMEQELGIGWSEGVHPGDYTRCLETYTSAFDRRETFEMEYRLRRADGQFRWIYDCGAPAFSPGGELIGYIGSCIDITDRKQNEETQLLLLEEVSQLKNQLQADNIYLQEEIQIEHDFNEIVGGSDAMKQVLFKIEKVAPTDTTVLVTGETGTGKELFARAIHSASARKHRPLVRVNCAALPSTLVEAELFGHERGAFTGADSRRQGRFELANGATIFLDEIGELPLESQVKLLRVIQEGEFERLGSAKTIRTEARIIAATNRDLNAEVEKGVFRKDLWYRLNVFPIMAPSLRERKEDIPLLVDHFVRRFAKRLGRTITSIYPATMSALVNYSWPGNVRELANVIERAVISSRGSTLFLAEPLETPRSIEPVTDWKTLEEVEREYILRVLDGAGGKVEGESGAARVLGVNPSTLRGRMVKLGIRRVDRAQKSSTTAN